jgi:hypothetical protein
VEVFGLLVRFAFDLAFAFAWRGAPPKVVFSSSVVRWEPFYRLYRIITIKKYN